MHTAIAMARTPAGTTLTIATLTGPVLRNNRNSATKNHTRYEPGALGASVQTVEIA